MTSGDPRDSGSELALLQCSRVHDELEKEGKAMGTISSKTKLLCAAVGLAMSIGTSVHAGGSLGLMAKCPCVRNPLFLFFVEGNPHPLTSTDNPPTGTNFARLAATNLDLVVLFEFPPQLYCGSHRPGDPDT